MQTKLLSPRDFIAGLNASVIPEYAENGTSLLAYTKDGIRYEEDPKYYADLSK